MVVSLIIACLAAYAFARMEFPGKRTLFNLILALMVVPPVVMVVPLFVSMVRWKLINTYHGVDPDLRRPAAALLDLPDDQLLQDDPAGDHRSGAHRRLLAPSACSGGS